MAKKDRLIRLLNMVLIIQAYPGKSTRSWQVKDISLDVGFWLGVLKKTIRTDVP